MRTRSSFGGSRWASKGNYGYCFWKCAHDIGETFSRVVIFRKNGQGNRDLGFIRVELQ